MSFFPVLTPLCIFPVYSQFGPWTFTFTRLLAHSCSSYRAWNSLKQSDAWENLTGGETGSAWPELPWFFFYFDFVCGLTVHYSFYLRDRAHIIAYYHPVFFTCASPTVCFKIYSDNQRKPSHPLNQWLYGNSRFMYLSVKFFRPQSLHVIACWLHFHLQVTLVWLTEARKTLMGKRISMLLWLQKGSSFYLTLHTDTLPTAWAHPTSRKSSIRYRKEKCAFVLIHTLNISYCISPMVKHIMVWFESTYSATDQPHPRHTPCFTGQAAGSTPLHWEGGGGVQELQAGWSITQNQGSASVREMN